MESPSEYPHRVHPTRCASSPSKRFLTPASIGIPSMLLPMHFSDTVVKTSLDSRPCNDLAAFAAFLISLSISSRTLEKYSWASCCCQLLIDLRVAGVHIRFPLFEGSFSSAIKFRKESAIFILGRSVLSLCDLGPLR